MGNHAREHFIIIITKPTSSPWKILYRQIKYFIFSDIYNNGMFSDIWNNWYKALTYVLIMFYLNTSIYNLISVPQITRFFLADAIILSKTGVVEAKSRRKAIVEVKNDKTILTILSFVRVLYLWCFCSLKFENSLFSNKLFNFIFWSKRIVYTVKKVHIKYIVLNWLVQTTFFSVETVTGKCRCCHKLRLFRFMEYTIQGTADSWNVLKHERPAHQIENII